MAENEKYDGWDEDGQYVTHQASSKSDDHNDCLMSLKFSRTHNPTPDKVAQFEDMVRIIEDGLCLSPPENCSPAIYFLSK